MSTTTTLLNKAILERSKNFDGNVRKMGIEIEFAGLDAQTIVALMQQVLGGDITWKTPFEVELEHPNHGTYKLELDSKQIKELGIKSSISGNPADAEPSLQRTYIETVSKLAENFVPWEIVSPPLALKDTVSLFPLIDQLREAGALGTKAAMRYAFGVHLNPEPIDLSANNLLRNIQSFVCLYDWIVKVGDIDVARRITPYIDHFGRDYIIKILAHDYQPSREELIQDYLTFNPTRNRSLDMLPMFAHLDEAMVRRHVNDDRVKSRPTFHYRLPNCEIDNIEWNLNRSIEIWMAIEEFAESDQLLAVCEEYSAKLNQKIPILGSAWADRLAELISLPEPDSWKQKV